MNVVVTQTAINASVSDLNVSASVTSTPVSVTVSSGLLDAPSNGLTYGRNNGAWASITGTGGGSSLPVADTQTIVMGSVDSTKLLRFEVDGFTAGATRVLTPPNQDTLLAGQNFLNVFTVNQQITADAAIGTNSNVGNPGQLLFPGTVFDAALSIEQTFTGSPNFNVGTLSHSLINSSANNSTFSAGAHITIQTDATNTKNNTLDMFGVFGQAIHLGSGEIRGVYGLSYLANNNGVGHVDYIIGVSAATNHYGGGTTDEAYGVYITNYTEAGLGVQYGLYIEPVTGASTSNYAIYTKEGDIRLMASASDKLGFHGATPVAKQTVTGSRGSNAALADLLTKLANLGLIVNSTSA